MLYVKSISFIPVWRYPYRAQGPQLGEACEKVRVLRVSTGGAFVDEVTCDPVRLSTEIELGMLSMVLRH